MPTQATPVLIVGGGLAGLATAAFLASRNIRAILVDKYPGSSLHPRAVGYTERTMEHLRELGLSGKVAESPDDFRLRRAQIFSLAGEWFGESEWTPGGKGGARAHQNTFTRGAAIAQDRIEPILRDRAVELGADIRLETELLHFSQDADGITAMVRPRGGEAYEIRADYMVGADGHASGIREALGIGRSGRGKMRSVRSILFRAPLDEYLKSGVTQFEIDQPDFKSFLTTYHDGRWLLILPPDMGDDEATMRGLIERAIGRSDLPIEIIVSGSWDLSALIADSFQERRVFLAGDAAHTLPPARGGFGANTGIDDAHNLAWKLAAVVTGQSAPALLETYDAERRPIAWLRHNQIFARPDYKHEGAGHGENVEIFDDSAIELGQLYRSAAVIGAGDDLPAARTPVEWAGQPGTRAPHHWVIRDGERIPLFDLFYRYWVLLTTDERWRAAAETASRVLGVKIDCVWIGRDVQVDSIDDFTTAFGITADGASLIRPDGYVGWRARDLPDNAAAALTEALGQIAALTEKVA